MKKITLKTCSANEAPLFYNTDIDNDKTRGCIGHLRGDFGNSGKEFWTSWWEHNEEIKTSDFAAELDNVVNKLRENSILQDRITMSRFCNQSKGRILGQSFGTFGFRVETDKYLYYIRCFPYAGNYNFYIYCYNRSKLENERYWKEKK